VSPLTLLRESFVPHLVVLIGVLGASLWFDQRAEEAAKHETVIQLTPTSDHWDPARVAEDGIVASLSGAAFATAAPDGGPADPAIAAAAERARAGDTAGALDTLRAATKERPRDASLWTELGAYALRSDRLDEAAEALDTALTLAPKPPVAARAHFNRGLVAARAGDRATARAHFEATLKLHPKDFEATLNLGLLDLDDHRPARAAERFHAAAQLAGGDRKARALFSLGVALGRQGKVEQALDTYDKAIEYQPTYLLPRYNQVVLLLRAGDPASIARGQAILDQTLRLRPDFAPGWFLRGRLASRRGEDDDALRAYERAAKLDPRLFKARYNAALVARRLGHDERARRHLERLVADFPKRPEPHFNLGRLAYKAGDAQAAIGHYRDAIRLAGGRYPEAEVNLALALRRAKKLDEALATLDALLRAKPGYAPALLNRGLVLARMGRLDEARQALQAAAKARPDDASALYNLGKLASKAKDHEAAIQAYRQALAVDPGHARAAVNLGRELARAKRYGEAEKVYRALLDRRPSYAPAYYNLGVALRAQGKLDEAAEAYRKVLELDEDNLKARNNLAVLYAKRGDFELAARTLNELLDRDPSHVKARYNLALQYERMGRLEDAAREYARVVKLKPDYRKAAARLAMVYVQLARPREALAFLQPTLEAADRAGDGEAGHGSHKGAKAAGVEVLAAAAEAHLALGEVTQAEALAQRAVAAGPRSSDAHIAAARVAAAKGDRATATEHLARAQALEPDAPDLARARAAILRAAAP